MPRIIGVLKKLSNNYGPFLFISLVACCTYFRTLHYELVWDDRRLIRFIASTVQDGGIAHLLLSPFVFDIKEPLGFYRPIILFSLWLDSLIASLLPSMYHLTNICLHTLVSVLVYWFLRLLTTTNLAAFLGAMIFALHPVHCESVAFVSGRTDLLATAFVLFSACAWFRVRSAASNFPRLERMWGLLAFIFALLSKELAVMLPVVLLLWDALGVAREKDSVATWWDRNGFWVVGWVISLSAVFIQRYWVAGVTFGSSSRDVDAVNTSVIDVVFTYAVKMLAYFRLLIIPWPLNAYYTEMDVHLDMVTIAGALLFLSLCLFLASYKSRYVGLLALSWSVAFLLPAAGIVAFQSAFIAERYLYLPSIGYSLAIGFAFGRGTIVPSRRIVSTVLVLLMAGTYGIATMKREPVWRDELTLFSDIVRTSPRNALAFYNLGNALRERERYEDAIRSYEKATQLEPTYYESHVNMGNALTVLGRYGEAIKPYRLAIAVDPDNALAHYNLGIAFVGLGDRRSALTQYRVLLTLDPQQAGQLLKEINP